MGEYNWAALAIPVFLGATLLEAWLARRRNPSLYALGTSLSDLACGSVFQSLELVLKLVTLAGYAWLYEHRFVDWPQGSVAPWILALLGVDLLFYAWHRASHVVNVLWAVHGVHHQSEDYNLAVALRQPLLEPLTWFPFYAVLALLGVHPVVYLIAYAVNRVYQFWIHTELVRQLPRPIEWIFNTPSHHRVHHGVQPQYLDKNFGAVLVLWDRLFGTFEPEGERVEYGTTTPLRSYNPLWANAVHLHRIWWLSQHASSWRQALGAWFAHPAWTPDRLPPEPKPSRMGYRKYRPVVARGLQAYVIVHLTLAGLALTLVAFFEHVFSPLQLLVACSGLLAAFVSPLGLIEHRPWAIPVERTRLWLTFLGAAWLLRGVGAFSGLAVGLGLLALAPLWIASLRFLRRRSEPQRAVK